MQKAVRKRLLGLVVALAAGAAALLVPAGSAGAAEVKTVSYNTTIRYSYGSYVIGNAFHGWSDVVQGGSTGSYRWGYLDGGTFQRCAWIYEGAVPAAGSAAGDACGGAQGRDDAYFTSTYTNGQINSNPNDGTATTFSYGHTNCADHNAYGNVQPWLVPAQPHNAVYQLGDGQKIFWRYVTRDGNWVMVRVDGVVDASPSAPDNPPNWVFVARNCLELT